MNTELAVARYRFSLVARQPVRLPPFPGPTLRGGLGHVLRHLVCVTRLPSCDTCLLRHTCAYPVLFQPYAPPDHPHRTRYARMPPPFVLRVPFAPEPFLRGDTPAPVALEAGEMLTFDLLLVGPAVRHAPYYIYAVGQLAGRGIGGRHQPFVLERVEACHGCRPQTVYTADSSTLNLPPPSSLDETLNRAALPAPHRLRVRFHTPVRLDLNSDLVYPIEFHHLVRGLLARWRAFQACYGPFRPTMNAPNETALLDLARHVRRAADHTRWLDLSRYSTRQRERLKMGGAVGEVVYESDADLTPFAPLLAFGQALHVGKLTSMGFGHMEVMPS